MKINTIIFFLASILIIYLPSCKKNSLSNIEIKNSKDSLSYSMGLITGLSMINASDFIDPLAYAKGIQDAFDGKNPTDEISLQQYITEQQMIIESKVIKKIEEANAEYAEKNIKFLENNKKKKDVVTTPSGLQYKIIKTGTGSKPSANDNITINYTAMTIDEKVFDIAEKQSVNMSQLVSGLTEGIQLMPIGSKFRFFVPAELGYMNANNLVPSNSTLIFDIELLEINKQ